MCAIVSGGGRGAVDDGDNMAGDDLISTVPILEKFERLNQATTILQLERPADWSTMAYGGATKGNDLTPDEIQSIMLQRVDFSKEAVASVCAGLQKE